MIYVRFTDSGTVYPCTNIDRWDEHHILLTFEDVAILNTSGFKFARYPDMEVINGNYSAFVTIFRTIGGKTVIYSDDESVWEEQ